MIPQQTVTLPDGRVLDVLILQRIASHEHKKNSVRLSALIGISEHPDSGFSVTRLKATSLQYPIIISYSGLILDGRHRVLRLLQKRRKTAICVVLSEAHMCEARVSKSSGRRPDFGEEV